MRLLKLQDNGRFSLTWFRRDKIPPYAILSHTWGREQDEVTFKDLINNTSDDKKGFQKLRFCNSRAEADNLHYFWVDTCCIDKSNSTELIAAINSMFRWYQNAAKCYVYLADVSIRDGQFPAREWESAFGNSRWFTRGWTLQELLAPRIVEFYSQNGERLGDKTSLQLQIHEISGIAVEALQGRSLSHFSIEERLRWGEKRETTEEEDYAYCLLGIFGVYMPLIPGEGKENAVKRLRRKIQKSSQAESQSFGKDPVVVSTKTIEETKTNEELEELMFKMRAKLFGYDREACGWAERGIGDVRLLKHKKTGKIRLVMRRDKTLKVCANHYSTFLPIAWALNVM
jgi:RanBP1 domain/Heterokaryon incompatibility protein (HET)